MWQNKKVVVAVTGGIAVYKVCTLVSRLVQMGAQVRVAMTEAATSFISPETFAALSHNPVYTQMFDRVEEIPHISLAQNSDLIVVAPATANILAKAALGIADDLVSAILVAASAPIVMVPSMNSVMWGNPAVQANLSVLVQRGVTIVQPESGVLACGTSGAGRYPELDEIMAQIQAVLSPQVLAGRKVLVTAGPTREYLDPVRFLSNPSTGLMGLELAKAAWQHGAEVTLVHGPISLAIPSYLRAIQVISALDMEQAVLKALPEHDVLLMTAAVADYRPVQEADCKLKKRTTNLESLALTRNPDILKEVQKIRRPDQIILGFAAETAPDLKALGQLKLEEKGLDFIVANRVFKSETGFGQETQTKVLVQNRAGLEIEFTEVSKADLAGQLCRLIAEYKAGETVADR